MGGAAAWAGEPWPSQNFGWVGSAPDPAGGAYSAPGPCLYLRGLLLRGWDGEKRERVIKGKGEEGEKWREGFGPPKKFGVAPPMLLN